MNCERDWFRMWPHAGSWCPHFLYATAESFRGGLALSDFISTAFNECFAECRGECPSKGSGAAFSGRRGGSTQDIKESSGSWHQKGRMPYMVRIQNPGCH